MKRKKKVPLIIEDHPENYNGYEFISLIRYNDKNYLSIIDNTVNNKIISYILDDCKQSKIDEEDLIMHANDWFENYKKEYPFSIYLSRKGKVVEFSKIIKCFNIEYVSRVIGPLYEYDVQGPIKVRRRKKKDIPKNISFSRK